jgi:hypothetical protein
MERLSSGGCGVGVFTDLLRDLDSARVQLRLSVLAAGDKPAFSSCLDVHADALEFVLALCDQRCDKKTEAEVQTLKETTQRELRQDAALDAFLSTLGNVESREQLLLLAFQRAQRRLLGTHTRNFGGGTVFDDCCSPVLDEEDGDDVRGVAYALEALHNSPRRRVFEKRTRTQRRILEKDKDYEPAASQRRRVGRKSFVAVEEDDCNIPAGMVMIHGVLYDAQSVISNLSKTPKDEFGKLLAGYMPSKYTPAMMKTTCDKLHAKLLS